MANFTPLWTTHESGLANAEGREIIVQHEPIFSDARQILNDLRVTNSAQSCNYHCLGFTPGKQSRAVSFIEDSNFNIDRAYGVIIPTVNARSACNYSGSDDFFLD